MTEENEFLTLEDAAKYIGVGRNALLRYIKELDMQTYKFPVDKRSFIAFSDTKRIKEVRQKPWLAFSPERETYTMKRIENKPNLISNKEGEVNTKDAKKILNTNPPKYYVYENVPTNNVTIHLSYCRYCNNGTGIQSTKSDENQWYGPYDTFEMAYAEALETGRKLNLCHATGKNGCEPHWETIDANKLIREYPAQT